MNLNQTENITSFGCLSYLLRLRITQQFPPLHAKLQPTFSHAEMAAPYLSGSAVGFAHDISSYRDPGTRWQMVQQEMRTSSTVV